MTRAEEQALKAYPKRGWKCKDSEGNDKFLDANRERRLAFIKGYEQALEDIWHNVKDEKPELRRTVICVNELMVEAELYTDDNELDEIEHYTKWCYLDDILPKE